MEEEEEGVDDNYRLIIETVDYSDSDEDRVIKVFDEGDDESTCKRLEIVSVNPLQLRPLPPLGKAPKKKKKEKKKGSVNPIQLSRPLPLEGDPSKEKKIDLKKKGSVAPPRLRRPLPFEDDPSEEKIDVITCMVWDDTWITEGIAQMLAEDKHNEGIETSDCESSDESPNTRSNELKRPLDDSPSSGDENPPKKTCKSELEENNGNSESCDDTKKENEELEKENDNLEEDNEERNDNDSERPRRLVNYLAENMMINSSIGFTPLIHVFKYLRVYELLRASRVCKMWKFIASHPSFWENVNMKNSMVHDWPGFVRYISTARTKHLSLKKMIGPSTQDSELIMWGKFCDAISSCSNELISVDMWRCTSNAFVAIAEASPQLKSLVSTAIKAKEIDLLPLKNNQKLEELKLQPFKPCLKILDYSFLLSLVNLTTLGLKSISNINMMAGNIPMTLETLELGECSNMSLELIRDIAKLKLLKRLRLEKGFPNCPTTKLLEAISTLPELQLLELINFEIKPKFDLALSKCTNIKFLLIIPTYFSQKATANSLLIRGLSYLKNTLTSVIWVITLELLRSIDTLLEQLETNKPWIKGCIPPKEGRSSVSCIPVIKKSIGGSNQIHIVKFTELGVMFHYLLPHTRIRIRRSLYDHTWNQTFS